MLGSLSPILSGSAPYVLDDFVERTFLYKKKKSKVVYNRPWVGISHHPANMPEWYSGTMRLERILEVPEFQQSLPYLKLWVCLSPQPAGWCRNNLDCPVEILKHPTGEASRQWSWDRYLATDKKMLVQVGWFLRNTELIYRLSVPPSLQKVHVRNYNKWVVVADTRCRQFCDEVLPGTFRRGYTREIGKLSPIDYDILLSQSVVFMYVLGSSANNAVVECIRRNTPICINRSVGPEYYLGHDYPLFYNHPSEVYDLLTPSRIYAAHRYLEQLDKSWISGDFFLEKFRSICSRHLPSTTTKNED